MSRHEHGITTSVATVVTQILLAKSSIRNILRKEMSPRSLPQSFSLPVCWETTLLGRKPYAAERVTQISVLGPISTAVNLPLTMQI
jgi:hypothetical protein